MPRDSDSLGLEWDEVINILKKSPHVTPLYGQSGERTPELDDFSGSFGSQVQQYSPAPAAFAGRRKFQEAKARRTVMQSNLIKVCIISNGAENVSAS